MPQPIHIVGGGLAGSEAAWQIASAGLPVVLHEMRPHRQTEAHKTDGLAELVCSNSFRSDDAADQRGRPAARGDAAGGLADHGRGRCPQAPRRRGAGGRSRSFLRRGDAPARRAPAHRHRARRGRRACRRPSGTASSSPPGRSPRRRCPPPSSSSPARPSSPSSTPSPPSCTSTPSIPPSPGASRATTSRAPPAPAPTTSTAR